MNDPFVLAAHDLADRVEAFAKAPTPSHHEAVTYTCAMLNACCSLLVHMTRPEDVVELLRELANTFERTRH
jgi:hypothetical protein